MLIWKFFKMARMTHASLAAPASFLVIHPARLTSLHPRMTDPTSKCYRHSDDFGMSPPKTYFATINDQIGTRWKRRGIGPGQAGDQPADPPGQNWTEAEQTGTPQQIFFAKTKETRLACGIYIVLSTLYAVRNWKIDFTQQAHIKNARNWLAAEGHAIKEIVSLHQC